MNTLIYMLATLFCGALSIRLFTRQPQAPVRHAFLLFGSLLSLCYLGFALYLLPGLEPFRYLHSAAAALLPAALYTLFNQMFAATEERDRPTAQRMWAVSPVVAIVFVVVDSTLYPHLPRASPAEVVLTLFVFAGFGLCIRRLLAIRSRLPEGPDRNRIAQLAVLLVLTLALSGLEDLIRALTPVVDTGRLSSVARPIFVQGAFPPIGAVLATLALYALHDGIRQDRPPDLRDAFSQLFTLGVMAAILVVVDGVTVIWVGSLADYPVHGTFQLFLASLLFLSAYQPIRDRVGAVAAEWFNRPGERLEVALEEIEQVLPKVISLDGLDSEVLGRLEASGRASLVSLYLWDQDLGTYRRRLQRGVAPHPLLETVAPTPFTEGFSEGRTRSYVLADLAEPRRRRAEEDEVRARVMRAMGADVTLALPTADVVLGWLNLKAASPAEAFSPEEVRRLEATADKTTVIVENVFGFERLKEQTRLAALGEMSAGLAHEIRNPLAGIKGAAQYIEGEQVPDEIAEFVAVIVEEVDRLNGVVTQFLDYARPYDIRPEPTGVETVIAHVIGLVKAQGIPKDVTLEWEAEQDLPAVLLDRDKVSQVLLNLVQNAVQAVGNDGSVQVRAREGLFREPGRRGQRALVINVTDTGPGIPAEDLDKLFIPFFTTKHDGTGLGLAICRRLIEAHGGEVGVRSREGSGSMFSVRLPFSPGDPRQRDSRATA